MSENTFASTTDINQIKNWFRTGLKPTQAQFWALIDSFYHKDEEIPQEKIKGLSESLIGKADASALDAKANADASGLSDDEKNAWKKALGVGELPSNIATVDKVNSDGESLEGNVYTKEKVNELLESSGKNLSNTDLSITQKRKHSLATGASLEFETLGNPFLISGLQDKTRDENYSKILKMTPEGLTALGEAFVFNVPESITVNNIGVNHIPEVSELVRRFKERLIQLHTSEMKEFEAFHIKTLNDIRDENISVESNNIITSVTPFAGDSIPIGTPLFSIHTDRVLPMDKDWCVSFGVRMGHSGELSHGQAGKITARKIGLYSSSSNGIVQPDIYVFDDGKDFSNNILALLSPGKGKKFSPRENANTPNMIYTNNQDAHIKIFIIKVGDSILLQAMYGSAGFSEIYSASSIGSGDFGFCVSVTQPTRSNNAIGLVSGVKYLIFN